VLDGIQPHIDAVASGEAIESRLELIRGSNFLNDEAKRVQGYFLKSFCLAAALEPLCGRRIELAPGLEIELNRSRKEIEGNELPGVRADSKGWLVVEGRYFRDGRRCADHDKVPLWPLMIRNAPVKGSGPWENFQPQALELLRQAGESWPS
jgi:hypothetical protein